MRLLPVLAALLIAAAAGAAAAAALAPDARAALHNSLLAEAQVDVEAAFERWARHHGRAYATAAERARRLAAFEAAAARVAAHAARADAPPYRLGLNSLADLEPHEFRARYFGAPRDLLRLRGGEDDDDGDGGSDGDGEAQDEGLGRRRRHSHPGRTRGPFPYAHDSPPSAVDWAAAGLVGPVKDQHVNGTACGCCYAFGAVAGVEAAAAVSLGATGLALSEQQVVDCDGRDHGCDGGDFMSVWEYARARGLTTQDDYPYRGNEGACARRREAAPAAYVGAYTAVPKRNATALRQALGHVPVTVAVCCGEFLDDWHLYSGGVFDKQCDAPLDHSVLVAGYGEAGADAGGDFWLIKNSWGAGWGEGGFMRVRRGGVDSPRGNLGMLSFPAFVSDVHLVAAGGGEGGRAQS